MSALHCSNRFPPYLRHAFKCIVVHTPCASQILSECDPRARCGSAVLVGLELFGVGAAGEQTVGHHLAGGVDDSGVLEKGRAGVEERFRTRKSLKGATQINHNCAVIYGPAPLRQSFYPTRFCVVRLWPHTESHNAA